MGRTSNRRLREVLSYKNDHGIDATCEEFNITASTIRRHERRAKNRDLDIDEEYEQPKVLIADIETSIMEGYFFETGKEYISNSDIKKEKSIISWSAKWLTDSDIMSKKATPEESINRDDKRILEPLWELINKADVIVGHNYKNFDKKIINSRAIVNNFNPPETFRIIDTYKQIRKQFSFSSLSLDHLTQKLCDKSKIETNKQLWIDCANGSEEALDKMLKYNERDVRVTEDLYLGTRGWYKGGVNLALFCSDIGNRCPRCTSKDLELSESSYYTSTGRFKTVVCNNCGSVGRERFADISTSERKELLRPTAR